MDEQHFFYLDEIKAVGLVEQDVIETGAVDQDMLDFEVEHAAIDFEASFALS